MEPAASRARLPIMAKVSIHSGLGQSEPGSGRAEMDRQQSDVRCCTFAHGPIRSGSNEQIA